MAACPLFTLLDRRVLWKNDRVWCWEYRGRYQDGRESEWINEEEAYNSFTSLQLDVFHALWEEYHDDTCRPRPPEYPSKEDRDAASREQAVKDFPVGTKVRQSFTDGGGQVSEQTGVVYDFREPYWKVRYPDGDWEELSRREINRGKTKADLYKASSSQ